MEKILKPGDIFLTKGEGIISKMIRFFTQDIGENRSHVNHVGLVVEEGNIQNVIVIEALSKVKEHTLWTQYSKKKKTSVAIYRANNLTDKEIETIVTSARKYVGMKYGYKKLFTHLLDWFFFGIYFFRRLVRNNKYPICSWLVANSYSNAGKHFDCELGAAEPDDIWDFIVEKRPDLFNEIHPLVPLISN